MKTFISGDQHEEWDLTNGKYYYYYKDEIVHLCYLSIRSRSMDGVKDRILEGREEANLVVQRIERLMEGISNA